ncbi:transposase [Streptomyces sp. NPDC048425]|uniref:transposase n=1 Tax=Streptomyces sp. NPDC048425 TaxID=3365548 RepID=UPI003713280D
MRSRCGPPTVPASSRGYVGGKKVPGRKRHIVTDCLGLFLVVAVTAANIGDRDADTGLLQRLRRLHRDLTLVWADGGYTGGLIGWCRDKLALTLARSVRLRTAESCRKAWGTPPRRSRRWLRRPESTRRVSWLRSSASTRSVRRAGTKTSARVDAPTPVPSTGTPACPIPTSARCGRPRSPNGGLPAAGPGRAVLGGDVAGRRHDQCPGVLDSAVQGPHPAGARDGDPELGCPVEIHGGVRGAGRDQQTQGRQALEDRPGERGQLPVDDHDRVTPEPGHQRIGVRERLVKEVDVRTVPEERPVGRPLRRPAGSRRGRRRENVRPSQVPGGRRRCRRPPRLDRGAGPGNAPRRGCRPHGPPAPRSRGGHLKGPEVPGIRLFPQVLPQIRTDDRSLAHQALGVDRGGVDSPRRQPHGEERGGWFCCG